MIKCHALLVFLLAARGAGADDYVLGPDSQFRRKCRARTASSVSIYEYPRLVPGTVRDGEFIFRRSTIRQAGGVNGFPRMASDYMTRRQLASAGVFDNLIAAKEMPVTIAIFLNPGMRADQSNRSFEYDSLGDRIEVFD